MLDSAMECDLRQNRVKKNRAELSGGSSRSQGRHSRTEGNVFVPARARHPFSVRTARAETIESDYGGGSCGAAPAPPRREWEKRQTPQPERPAARAERHRR